MVPPSIENLIGQSFFVVNQGSFYTCGGYCKLSQELNEKVSLGTRIIIEGIVRNIEDGVEKYPFIITSVKPE